MSTSLEKSRPALIQELVFALLILAMGMGLKYHYSRASSGALDWILGPTAKLVEVISGHTFERETGAGYVRADKTIIIAPACAGVNFMITAFFITAFTGFHRRKGIRPQIQWLGTSLAAAYILTIVVNAVRIQVTVGLYEAHIHYGPLTPERLHRLAGCVIYLSALAVFYWGVEKITRPAVKSPSTGFGRTMAAGKYPALISLLPLVCYGLITIIIPVLNGAFQKNGRLLAEHCATLFLVSGVVFLLVFLIRSMTLRLARPRQTPKP